jgi:hypothetical protein
VTRVSALGPGPEGNAVCQMLDCERKQQSKWRWRDRKQKIR